MEKKWKAGLLIIFAVLGAFAMVAYMNRETGPCDGRQWNSSQEELDCRYPDPPIGRWKAVYTKEFSQKYNLPPENISSDLSPGVDYMEMDVQPYGVKNNIGCFVNMLIKKPNDVAVYNAWGKTGEWGADYNAHRKLLHFVDLDARKEKLNEIHTFGWAPRNMKYDPDKTYGIGSSTAFYAEDIFEEYDYITAKENCYFILSAPDRFPDKWALNYAKASVWGRNEKKYKKIEDPSRPQGEDYFNSRSSINVPSELISEIFKDMPVGGR